MGNERRFPIDEVVFPVRFESVDSVFDDLLIDPWFWAFLAAIGWGLAFSVIGIGDLGFDICRGRSPGS